MTAYAVVQLRIRNAEAMAAYRSRAGEALARHGGRVIAGGPEGEVIVDTGGCGDDRIVLLAFDSAEGARAWAGDPDLAEVHALRAAGADNRVTLLGGYSL